MFIALFITAIVVVILCLVFGVEDKDAPPGPNSIPILGSIPFVPKRFRAQGRLHIPKLFNYLTQIYGPIFRIYLGPIPTVVITDLNLVKEAFKKDEVTARPPMKPFHEFRYGSADGNQRGVILSSGLEWQDQRRFSLRQLRDFGFGRSSMEAMILEEVQKLRKCLQKETGKPLDLSFKMNISIINALWLILVGERLELDDERLLKIVRTMDKLLRETQVSGLFSVLFPNVYKMIHPRFKFAQETFESMRTLMKQAILEHKETFQSGESPNDFIDCYLKEIENTKDPGSSFFQEQGLKSLDCVLIDLFMGGSETTSITLIWTFLFLLHHPEGQEKIHEKLDSVIGSPFPPLQDLPSLPLLGAVMSKILRLSRGVPKGVPLYVPQDTKGGDFVLKKGPSVRANRAGVHLNPVFGENAKKFQPERFLDKGGKFESPDSSHFAPFSVGKLFCLGQSLAKQKYFLFLRGIMQNFKLISPSGRVLPNYRFSNDNNNRGFIRYAPKYDVILQSRPPI
uniref:Cytochrome P450 CYP3034A1 n=1 Tax=Tigriopus japonicus TaxID=158387 RepID=A0A088DI86_TIGJA|nr:cytochrome P450 CYP3034A1 [Tigriopus japonicus]